MNNPLIIALDIESREKRQAFLDVFSGQPLYVKVGMELFYREGRPVIEELKSAGHHIFLDLKLHDIPNTVKRSMTVLAEMGVDIVNVHAAGGKQMMEAAREGLEAGTKTGAIRPKLIAVTQLTSTDEATMQEQLLIEKPLTEVVTSYAQLARKSGLDGVVCSAQEVPLIHESCGRDFITVTPGIRNVDDEKGDQKRVVTPAQARELGSWGIVVGRSITSSDNPLQTYLSMKSDWEG
ncbi:orotidine-5'-phosphate decarboxylase [Halalkalibacter urbisdiaboli]|uniref:orotidine-5'-phosphate decarboxylase n=1 Tax=Halalkalibacter urbisdiaboli TaxID=1960589 RepID=UPI000B433DF9|nr:orotidine-5'-phosphate decarboxylase [Halalkalibacter urbisdiaboli]